jgi:hypothetical protein
MFLVGCDTSVVRSNRPAIPALNRTAWLGCEHRLDRDHETVGKQVTRKSVLIVRDIRWFVNRPTHTVAAEFSYHREPVSPGPIFDGTPNDRHALSGPGGCQAAFEGCNGTGAQT